MHYPFCYIDWAERSLSMKKIFWTAKYDRVFKTILCDERNIHLMKEFLSRVLEREVQTVKFLRNELPVTNTKEKVKTVDVLAEVDGEYIHIEINTGYGKYVHVKSFEYFTTVYNLKTKRGDFYDAKTKFLHIDFTYHLGQDVPVREIYQVQSKTTGRNYIDNFTILEFNMDLIMKLWYDKDKEILEKYKHLIMLDVEDFEEIGKGDGFVEEFGKKVSELNEDEYFQSFMTIEEDREYSFNTEKMEAYDNGLEEGIEQGIEQNKIVIAKTMLQENMDKSLIAKITGLSLEEIDELQ